jgi:hypothetical protein
MELSEYLVKGLESHLTLTATRFTGKSFASG